MPRSAIVVGAGIVGCAIARDLAARGVACTVLDDRGVAAGATRASAGMLAPYVEAHEAGPLLDLAVRSLDLYPDWIDALRRDSGIDVEYAVCGTLEVASDGAAAAALGEAARAHGRWIDGADVQRAYPALRSCAGARFISEHAYVVPPQLAEALARAAARNGALFEMAKVERIERVGPLLQGGTTLGALRADTVVLAAGAWTNAIGGTRMPPIHPVRGQIVELAWPGPPLTTILWGSRCYIVPRRAGSVLVGATVEDAGFDERTTAGGVRELLDAACELVPAARGASFVQARAGLRPAAPDHLPVLGADPSDPAIVHASGHYRNGVLLAPITARLIGDLVVDDRRDACLDSFRVDRFS